MNHAKKDERTAISRDSLLETYRKQEKLGFFHSFEETRRAYKHEIEHIRKNHLFIDKPVEACEEEAKT
jgi:effector-binding domain-containing protein